MKKEKKYARKYAKDFNFLTILYQKYAVFLYRFVFNFFYRFKFEGQKNIKKGSRYIVAANHISYFDPLLLSNITGLNIAYMAKKELFEGSKWFAKRLSWLGAFAVNRENPEVSTIKTVLDVSKAKWNLGIFPQGGIRRDRTIRDINKGFIVFAKMLKLNILPVGITGCEQYNWKLFSGKINVKIGEEIPYDLSEEEILKRWASSIEKLTGYNNELRNEENIKKCLT